MINSLFVLLTLASFIIGLGSLAFVSYLFVAEKISKVLKK